MELAAAGCMCILLSFLRKNFTSALEWGYPYSKFSLERYIVKYTVAIKLNFQQYIRGTTSIYET